MQRMGAECLLVQLQLQQHGIWSMRLLLVCTGLLRALQQPCNCMKIDVYDSHGTVSSVAWLVLVVGLQQSLKKDKINHSMGMLLCTSQHSRAPGMLHVVVLS